MPAKVSKIPGEGTKAPAFSLPGSSGETVKLADLKGRAFVLYFYPKDATSGLGNICATRRRGCCGPG